MSHLYLLYRLGYLIYDLVTFGRHPWVSAFWLAMGIAALVVYGRRGKGRRR